jgi:hypothetical protein
MLLGSRISIIKFVPDETLALLPTLEADAVDDEDADQPVKLVLKRTVFVTSAQAEYLRAVKSHRVESYKGLLAMPSDIRLGWTNVVVWH